MYIKESHSNNLCIKVVAIKRETLLLIYSVLCDQIYTKAKNTYSSVRMSFICKETFITQKLPIFTIYKRAPTPFSERLQPLI